LQRIFVAGVTVGTVAQSADDSAVSSDRSLSFHTVDLAGCCNANMFDSLYGPQFPLGDVAANGVPFHIPTSGKNFIWPGNAVAIPVITESPVAQFGVVQAYTLINTTYGAPGPASYAFIEFFGS